MALLGFILSDRYYRHENDDGGVRDKARAGWPAITRSSPQILYTISFSMELHACIRYKPNYRAPNKNVNRGGF